MAVYKGCCFSDHGTVLKRKWLLLFPILGAAVGYVRMLAIDIVATKLRWLNCEPDRSVDRLRTVNKSIDCVPIPKWEYLISIAVGFGAGWLVAWLISKTFLRKGER